MLVDLIKNYKRLVLAIIIVFFIIFLLSRGLVYRSDQVEFGVTFSKKQALDLGLDWQKAYLDILNKLKVRKIRLAAYWDEIEAEPGQYDFSDLDWQIEQACLNGAEIILAAGGRLPRWPECHFPDWANSLPEQERQERILAYIEKVITRYQDREAITAWQIENEPFLPHFGECPKLNPEFLDQEIALARKLDRRPIVVTDSGELSLWVPAAKRADIFGTTMYRDTYSELLQAYVHYPIEPGFFRFKKNVSSWFADPQKWVVIELQAEPWGPKPFQYLSPEERSKTMDLRKFKEIIEFSRQTGFREFYLWGVEWWYWEKEKNQNSELWEEAQKLFVDN